MSFIGALLRKTRTSRAATSGVRKEIASTTRTVRSGRAAERELRRTQGSVQSQIDKSLAGLNKAGSAATISGALGRAGAYGGIAAAGMGFASGIKEKFGHQMSGAANFGIGAAGVALGLGAGLAGVTQLGRAGIMAHGRYSSNLGGTANSLKSDLVTTHRTARNSRRTLKKSGQNLKDTVNTARPNQIQSRMGMGTGSLRTRIGPEGIVPGNPGATFMAGQASGSGPVGIARFRRYQRASARSGAGQRAMNEARRVDKTAKQASTVSNRAKNTSANIKEAMGDSKTVFKNLKANKQRLDRFDSYRKAQNFSARRIALGIGKLPFTMGGAMLGKGSGMFGGAVDPAMKFIGPAMAMGTWSGLAAGTGVGIAAVKSGNLGRTQGAAQRPQGRSFSNISYNATLHAHRISK